MRIDAMLAGLPTRGREIFPLAKPDASNLSQVAERTQTPLATVRRHI